MSNLTDTFYITEERLKTLHINIQRLLEQKKGYNLTWQEAKDVSDLMDAFLYD